MQHLDTKPLVPPPDTPANPFDGLVSVIVPTYNCAATLPRSLESLKNQTYPKLEILVVDDASTDDTQTVVGQAGVTYIRLDQNSGAAVARNTGARQARGDIYLFAEADGYYDEDYVAKILRYLHLPGVVGAINLGRKVWTDRDTPLVRHHNDLYAAAAQRVLRGTRGTGAWAFHKAPFWEVDGYDPQCRIGQDMDLVRRLFRAGGKTVVGGFSTLYHKDPDSLVKYWRRKNDHAIGKVLYAAKYAALAAAPLYLIASAYLHGAFMLPFLGVIAYLLLEDPTTTLAWSYSLRRYDMTTFLLTPAFLYFRRLAIGWGRIRSFFSA